MNQLVPPILGADIELGNAWIDAPWRSNLEAASLLLRQVPARRYARGFGPGGGAASGGRLEWGRHWLTNGGCIYVDMAHLELCTPETRSARDHAAAVHAMIQLACSCRRRAVASLPEGQDLFVFVHNSDGTLGTSWGAHQNVAVSRRFWDDLFQHRKPHLMALLASFLAAAVPVFGQGMVVPLKRGCRYATSARAHHLGSLVTLSTVEPFNRGLLNSRDEAHAADDLARLHLIAFDASLQPATILLRSGLVQLVVAALQCGWFDAALLLDDPVKAVKVWSWGFDLASGVFRPAAVPRPQGSPVGLFAWHRRLLDGLRPLVDAGRISEEIVPEGSMILDLWEETLDALIREDLTRMARRLDWALKWTMLAEFIETSPDLSDPRCRLLDLHYGHVDDRVGLFWHFWREGQIDPVIDARLIRRFRSGGDPHTRSGLRGELVRRLRPWIIAMDWSYLEVSRDRARSWWQGAQRHRLAILDPAGAGGLDLDHLRTCLRDDEALLEYLITSALAEDAVESSSPRLCPRPEPEDTIRTTYPANGKPWS
jgi:proteasome accessory factor A